MIGLGVGIDYTLFIVTRFRQLLHDGLTPHEAAAAAGATAGRAVIFAGVTVAISITGLAVIGIDFITKLGIGSALGVLTAVLLANSLLPAVLSLLGHKIDRGRLGMKPIDESREGQSRTPVAAWGRFVSRNAKIVLPVVIVVLLRARLAGAGRAAGPGRRRHGAEGPDHPQGLRPAVRGLRPRLHRRRSRSWSTCAATTRRPQKIAAALQEGARRRAGRQADLQRQDAGAGVGRDHQHLLEVQAAGREDRRHRLDPPRHDDPHGARRDRRRVPTCPAQNAAFTDIGNQILARHAVVPALHHRRHLPGAGDGVPVGGDRDQGGADDAGVGAGRVRHR